MAIHLAAQGDVPEEHEDVDRLDLMGEAVDAEIVDATIAMQDANPAPPPAPGIAIAIAPAAPAPTAAIETGYERLTRAQDADF